MQELPYNRFRGGRWNYRPAKQAGEANLPFGVWLVATRMEMKILLVQFGSQSRQPCFELQQVAVWGTIQCSFTSCLHSSRTAER